MSMRRSSFSTEQPSLGASNPGIDDGDRRAVETGVALTPQAGAEQHQKIRTAVREHRVVYASNHRSHTDYLVQPLVLDDNGIRPPLIAAGINLFGGPLGLIHKHVTGAIPIRRNTKDPAYLITLKAYVAEILKRQDIFFYPEGGRSYSGELKPMKTGLIHATLQAECPNLVIVPVAIAYDLILEDHILARQGTKKRQRPFSRAPRIQRTARCTNTGSSPRRTRPSSTMAVARTLEFQIHASASSSSSSTWARSPSTRIALVSRRTRSG